MKLVKVLALIVFAIHKAGVCLVEEDMGITSMLS